MTRPAPFLAVSTTAALCLLGLGGQVRAAPAGQKGEAVIEALLARMTLAEKIGQLTQIADRKATGPVDYADPGPEGRKAQIRAGRLGSILNAAGAAYTNAFQKVAVEESRLKIPLLFGLDVIHGYETIFPVPLAQAASWDLEAIERAETIAAREASAAGIRWTFSPMVDVARDPRWGRVMEGSGEDSFLGAAVAAARVRGFQGPDPSQPDRLIACAKHFAAYGGAEGGRDYNTVDVSERTLREVYFPPFRATVRAGVGTFMTAFNEIAGVPASASRFLFSDVLRGEWGFRGFVVSDWRAIDQLRNHGVAATRSEAGRMAFAAGVDMDMVDDIYQEELAKLVRSGAVSMKEIDLAVRRILRVKLMAGLFEHPFTDESRAARDIRNAAHLAEAREMARRSIVLLKNQSGLLPLAKTIRSLAVLGPLADSGEHPMGEWSAKGDPRKVVTLLQGLQNKLGTRVQILHARGTDVEGKDGSEIPKAVAMARQAEVVVLAVGEARGMSGEAKSRSQIDLPGRQKELVRAVQETGKPVVLVVMSGRPLTLASEAEKTPAILAAWLLGSESGNAIADVLFGDYNPSGKLPISFPRTLGQVPLYYNHKNTGRPYSKDAPTPFTSRYLDTPNTPQWPFGFGLSYTQFKYSNLAIGPGRIAPRGEARVSVDVQNVGGRAGVEVVQLYIRDLVGSTTRPVKELRGFQRIALGPEEKKTVSFTLGPGELSVLDDNWKPLVEPGQFLVWVGPSSAEGLEGKLEVAREAAAQVR